MNLGIAGTDKNMVLAALSKDMLLMQSPFNGKAIRTKNILADSEAGIR